MALDENKPKYIVLKAIDSSSLLFWDDKDVGIGDVDSFYIGDDEYSMSSLEGLNEWFLQADIYDPFEVFGEFTTEGMEEWINQGYEYAKQLRALIPKDVKLYYAYLHQFGDGKWRHCEAYIE